jgi:osmotically-inducible protein OsmY
MRRYRKWVMTLGLVAAAPNVGLAGPFDFFRPKTGGAPADAAYNQQVAEQVAARLRIARLRGQNDIDIKFESGVLTLTGEVADAPTKALATQLASSVSGVQKVDNQMTTGTPAGEKPAGPIRQVSAEAPAGANPFAASRGGVQSAAFEMPAADRPSGIQQVGGQKTSRRQFSPPPAPAPSPTAPQAGGSNQQTAEQVAAALQQAGLSGYDLEAHFNNGVCTLAGTVASPQQAQAAIQAARGVPGVTKVVPKLRMPASVMPTNYQPADGDAAANGAPMPPGYPAVPPGYPAGAAMPPGYPPGMAGPPAGVVPPPPGWAQPGAAAVAPVYDQPSLPQYAWPSYAAYPNYAALTYPKQYSASAWPYIGPFYPYPQVPLGWRSVTLEWDDGHWFLDFNDRTDRWWWFFNPKNW